MYQFTEDCMVGITQIDEEHRRLFEMINETQKLLQEKHGSVASAKNLVKKLKEYAQVHFAHEEQYMEKTNDPTDSLNCSVDIHHYRPNTAAFELLRRSG